MSPRARLGFVGLGTMGRDLLGETAKNPKAEISALCDVDPEALQKAQEILGAVARQFADYREMLDMGGLDAVVVAVPQHLHAALSIESLNAGCGVFCEKPMGMNVAECREMAATAERNRKVLMIGQVLRYINPYKHILEPGSEGGVHREMREFVEAILDEHPVTISGNEGLRNVEIAEACYLSIQERQPIPLPLTTAT